MNPVEAISSVFGNYANFDGRAPRSEYWWFTLFSFAVGAVLLLLMNYVSLLGAILALIVTPAMLLPTLALWVRRLHDTNRSAWWLLLLVPPISIIGYWVLLVFDVLPGTLGPNRYGDEPW